MTDWATVLVEGSAYVVGAVVAIGGVVVGARVYREGVKDRPVDPADPEHDPDPPE